MNTHFTVPKHVFEPDILTLSQIFYVGCEHTKADDSTM